MSDAKWTVESAATETYTHFAIEGAPDIKMPYGERMIRPYRLVTVTYPSGNVGTFTIYGRRVLKSGKTSDVEVSTINSWHFYGTSAPQWVLDLFAANGWKWSAPR